MHHKAEYLINKNNVCVTEQRYFRFSSLVYGLSALLFLSGTRRLVTDFCLPFGVVFIRGHKQVKKIETQCCSVTQTNQMINNNIMDIKIPSWVYLSSLTAIESISKEKLFVQNSIPFNSSLHVFFNLVVWNRKKKFVKYENEIIYRLLLKKGDL